MAVRFSANGQYFTSTVSIPASTTFTVTMLVNLSTDRNAVSGLFSLMGTVSLDLQTTSTGTSLEVRPSNGGSASTALGSLVVGTWYRLALTYSNGSLTYMFSAIGSALPNTSASTCGAYSGLSSLRIGASATSTNYFDGRIAAFKMWSSVLTTVHIQQELMTYLPKRTSDLLRWHPFISNDLPDYSGHGGVLTGGVGTATEAGPPLPWGASRQLILPWDPATTLWLAIYDTTTGELFSGDYLPNVSLPLPAGLDYKEYLGGPPDITIYEWSAASRSFVFREGIVYLDRCDDLIADPTLASAWAALDSTKTAAMKARIGQLLGPWRYRQSFQPIDLEPGY